MRRHGLVVPALDEGPSRPVPRYLVGVSDSCSVDALCEGGKEWRKVWHALGKPAQKRIKRFADWGQAVVPSEYAALAVGRARAVRRYQNRRLFPLLPLIPALQAVYFGFMGMIQKSGVGYVEELRHQLVHTWFWINVAFAVVIFPTWQRVASYRSERLNRAQVEQAPMP